MARVIVIGGGPAGMISAITAAENGNEVLIIEKNEYLEDILKKEKIIK